MEPTSGAVKGSVVALELHAGHRIAASHQESGHHTNGSGSGNKTLLAQELTEPQGRLNGKQIVVVAMRKLLVLSFGVLKSGKRFDPAIATAA